MKLQKFADPPEVSIDESGANLTGSQMSTTNPKVRISSSVLGNAWVLLF